MYKKKQFQFLFGNQKPFKFKNVKNGQFQYESFRLSLILIELQHSKKPKTADHDLNDNRKKTVEYLLCKMTQT